MNLEQCSRYSCGLLISKSKKKIKMGVLFKLKVICENVNMEIIGKSKKGLNIVI